MQIYFFTNKLGSITFGERTFQWHFTDISMLPLMTNLWKLTSDRAFMLAKESNYVDFDMKDCNLSYQLELLTPAVHW